MGENPARAQISAVLLYFGYLLVAVGIFFGIIHLVRYRAVALAHVAGVLAVWGWSALPGRLVFDFYDLSLAQASNREEAIAISERASGYPGSVIMDVPELLENAVHSLEHGAVWITYYPDLPQGEIVRLTDLNQSNSYVLVSPYPDQDAPVVATA